MLRLAATCLLSLAALGCGGSPRAGGPSPTEPAPPPVIGTTAFTVTAAPDRALPAIAWYPARQPGPDAPPVLGRKLPVLVMSHGLGGKKEHAAFLAERVAAEGYLVIAIDHVNDGIQLGLQRPVDVTKLLDRLADRAAQPAHLAELADLEHVAVYGHSFGGYTALALAGATIGANADWTEHCAAKPAAFGCPAPTAEQLPTVTRRDPRVDLVVGAAPAGYFQFGKAGTAAIATPIVLLAGARDTLVTTTDFVRPLFDHARTPRWFLELEHGNHMTFVDLCAKLDRIPPPFNAETAQACAPDNPLELATAHLLIGDIVLAALDHLFRNGPAPDLAALASARQAAGRADAAP
jgi:predicted dienelactone hydrolase